MKTLAEFMEETVFFEGPYIRTHGRKPPIHGSFNFSTLPNASDEDHRFHYVSKYTTYEKAKEDAKKYFAYPKFIYLLP